MLTRRTFLGLAATTAATACSKGPARPADYLVFGARGIRRDGTFLKPRGIHATPQQVYVIDTTGRVQIFDHEGAFLQGFQTPDPANGTPTGATINRAGNIVIPDTHYSRVLEYTTKGEPVKSWGSFGAGPDNFIYPTGIDQGPDNLYYISEYGEGANRVHVFDEQGAFVRQWGEHGEDPGQFNRPMGIAVGGDGLVYVADTANHRVQVFEPDGVLVRIIGGIGHEPGKLKFPFDITLAGDDTMLLAEYAAHRVSRFDKQGNFIACYGSAGREPGQFNAPRGVSASGLTVFVADTDNHRAQRFEMRPV